MEDLGLSIETRISRQWGVAASLDPLKGCETSLPPTSTHYGLGVDVFWERRGLRFGGGGDRSSKESARWTGEWF
ncbi:MAG: hypothetical protein HY700_09715 [Gemmatimonadetes bacterium]|nr:hypothetical protein [Gemmatimonadota bacterium]